MIGYTTLGTNDLDRATEFYDGLLAADDVIKMAPSDRVRLWIKKGEPMFGIAVPYDGKEASVGNGVMIGLSVDSPEQVHAMYERAIELGAKDEGEPGPRGENGFYGGYFRDMDGNKLVAFCRVKPKK